MRHRGGVARLVGAMNAAEELENRGIERLRAEADAVHARRAHPDEFRYIDGARIRLEGDFRVVLESKQRDRRSR